MQDLERKYQFLKEHSIPSSESLVFSTTDEVETKRSILIKKHRRVIMLKTLDNSENFADFLPEKSMLTQFVLDPIEISPPKVTPQFLQQASHLFSFIHGKCSFLLDALLKFQGKPEFYALVQSAIPSLFGYFSSPEHIQFAFSFYVRVLTSAPESIRLDILHPFFDSPIIFRFIESSLRPFFDRFIRDDRFDKYSDKEATEKLIPLYTKIIVDSFADSSKLLHSTHLFLLRLMRSNWSIGLITEFVIVQWLQKQTIRWLYWDQHYSRSKFIQQIFALISSDVKYVDQLMNAFCVNQPQFELPDMYNEFSHPYLMFYSSQPDICVLSKAIMTVTELTPSMSIFFSENVQKNAMFWIKIYPKRPLPKPYVHRPMVFHEKVIEIPENQRYERYWRALESKSGEFDIEPFTFLMSPKMNRISHTFGDGFNDYALASSINQLCEKASYFEQFLCFRLSLRNIENWLEIVETHEQILLAPYSIMYVKYHWSKRPHNRSEIFAFCSKFFVDNSTKQIQFLSIIGFQLQELIKPYINDFKEINTIWAKVLDDKEMETESLNTRIEGRIPNAMFWDCVETLRVIDKDSLFSSIKNIIKATKILFELSILCPKASSIFEKAIFLSRSPSIPLVYLLFKAYVMDDLTFTNLLSESEKYNWALFERSLISLVMKCDPLKQLFFSLLNKISPI